VTPLALRLASQYRLSPCWPRPPWYWQTGTPRMAMCPQGLPECRAIALHRLLFR
jgi:hypothetical protein